MVSITRGRKVKGRLPYAALFRRDNHPHNRLTEITGGGFDSTCWPASCWRLLGKGVSRSSPSRRSFTASVVGSGGRAASGGAGARRGSGRAHGPPVLRGRVRRQRREFGGVRQLLMGGRPFASVPPAPPAVPLTLPLWCAGCRRAWGRPTGTARLAESSTGDQWFAAQVAVMQAVDRQVGHLHLSFHGVPLVTLVDLRLVFTLRSIADAPEPDERSRVVKQNPPSSPLPTFPRAP